MKKGEAAFSILNSFSALCIQGLSLLILCITSTASADSLDIDKRTLDLDDTATVTVTLEGRSAGEKDSLSIPVTNFVLGTPAVSTEFTWVNGASLRRKVFRYPAHAQHPGDASVGPLVIDTSDGARNTLPAIAIQVFPSSVTATSTPDEILRALLASNRDPIFLMAEISRGEVFTGEEVVVTWVLYNATSVERWGIVGIPKLNDFWTEDLDVRSEQPQDVAVGGLMMQRLVVRRAALFPLRSGALTVGSQAVEAQVLRRVRTNDPFGMFEGALVDVRRSSPELPLNVRPLPPGPPVDTVGDIALTCGTPQQKAGGPVSREVTLWGRGNLRSAPPPRVAGNVDGTVQITEGTMANDRRGNEITMSRTWHYLIFPSHGGPMMLPPLVTRILTPLGERRELRCEASTLQVHAAPPPRRPPPPPPAPLVARRSAPWIAVAAVAALLLLAIASWWRRAHRARVLVRTLMEDRRPRLSSAATGEGSSAPRTGEGACPPEVTRENVDGWLRTRGIDPLILIAEASERGDSYRALRSLLDGIERQRIAADRAEVAERVAGLVRTIGA